MASLKNHALPRSLIRVKGHSDAAQNFLNKYFTRNIVADLSPTGKHGLFLNDKGRILSDAIVISGLPRQHEVIYIDCPKEAVEDIHTHLCVYAEYSTYEIELLLLESQVFCTKLDATQCIPTSSINNQERQSILIIQDPRDPMKNTQRLYIPSEENTSSLCAPTYITTKCMSKEEFNDLRYSHGIPEGMGEFCRGSSLPTQYNYDYLGGIDFTKGCYLGQELTSRTHFTGVTRRRIVPFLVDRGTTSDVAYRRHDSSSPPEQIKVFECESERQVGTLIALQSSHGLVMHQHIEELSMNVNENKFAYCYFNGQLVKLRCYMPFWWPRKHPN
ncbi:transferase CAF17 [Perkinsela sp. CCAP 1560/4]|nr:transferase CAF17 [Perkinsela sp. CCAP 1560/4]|eukprot:KNH07424.1 transferase CAF17 [Perkinsela sp. CCAP 1560/4]